MIKPIIKLLITSMFLLSDVHAEDKVVTMRTLLDGINLTQLGLLTNTEALVREGVLEIKVATTILGSIERGKYHYLDEIQTYAYNKKKAQALSTHADQLLKEFNDNNITRAMQEYNLLALQCVECHLKLRDYQDRGNSLR
ncbi:MAG: hypothetical protein PHU40_05115 [Sulfurimonas sp.]|nr:hypothetical protein [Sulfurimonas sp.]